MREIVHLQVGQCGNQIGSKVRNRYCLSCLCVYEVRSDMSIVPDCITNAKLKYEYVVLFEIFVLQHMSLMSACRPVWLAYLVYMLTFGKKGKGSHSLTNYVPRRGNLWEVGWPRWRLSGQLHVPAALSPGKKPRYPLHRRLGGPQNRSGRCGEGKILDLTRTGT
jgi:hypothetical protein